MAIITEIRFYSKGWVIRFYRFQLRWNHQDNYAGIMFEWLQPTYFAHGGMTWKEFVIVRKQRKAEETEYRRLAKDEAMIRSKTNA